MSVPFLVRLLPYSPCPLPTTVRPTLSVLPCSTTLYIQVLDSDIHVSQVVPGELRNLDSGTVFVGLISVGPETSLIEGYSTMGRR